jgi:hypothetical protein
MTMYKSDEARFSERPACLERDVSEICGFLKSFDKVCGYVFIVCIVEVI